MTRRLEFARPDIHYLANLCHGCGACLHACQYAPPHEFAVNVPQAMARVRGAHLRRLRLAAAARRALRRNGLTLAVALAAGLALFLVLALAGNAALAARAARRRLLCGVPARPAGGDLRRVVRLRLLALGIGVRRFWSDVVARQRDGAGACRSDRQRRSTCAISAAATAKAATTRTTRSACAGAASTTSPSTASCSASPRPASRPLYHYALGQRAPYPLPSLPVVLGTLGGIGLLVGPAGLLWLHLRRDPPHAKRRSRRWTAASSPCCCCRARPAWPCSPGATARPWACCSPFTWAW